jgi:Na+/H+ antiporter NhaD/arsenite permease-like protein
MAFSQPAATVMLVSAIGVTAAVLTLWQRYERRHREPVLPEADARHFARQDFRRALVGVVLVLLALGITAGSRLEHKIAGQANPWFLAVWLAVFTLIFILLWLALLDWVATWLYARRHRRQIARERIQFLRDQRRRRAYRGNGQDRPREPPDDASAG